MISSFTKRVFVQIIVISIILSGTFTASAFAKAQSETAAMQHISNSHQKRLSGSRLSGNTSLPEKYKTPLLTSVKNQGSQGLCWSFAAFGCLEAFMLNEGLGEYDFSEEHPNFWALDDGNGCGWIGRSLGEGAWAEVPIGYLVSWHGPVSEEDVPYQNGDSKKPEKYDSAKRLAGVTGVVFLKNDRDSIKRAIMDYYAVSASYNSLATYNNYDGSAYYSPEISDPVDGHAICVVGWDDNYPKENFGNALTNYEYQPKNDGAWLCKNSWGTSGGYDNGYLWISYEDAYLFNESYGTSYAITSVELPKGNTKLYQVEEYGATYKYPVKYDHSFEKTSCTFTNIYDFDSEFKTLDKVVFYTDSVGASYTVYYIPLDKKGKPDTNKSHWTELSSGTVEYNGYLCDDFDDYTVTDDRGAIGIYLNAANGGTVTIGVDEWMTEAKSGLLHFFPGMKSDISFLIDDDGCKDIFDLYRANGDYIGGQISIKVIANSDASVSGSDTDSNSDSERDTDIHSDTDTTPAALCGDVNKDSRINMEDVVYIQKVIAKLISPDTDFLTYGDVNNDGAVNLVDVTLIQRYIAKLILKLPI